MLQRPKRTFKERWYVKKILIVDDMTPISRAVARMLRHRISWNLEILMATDGIEAEQLIREQIAEIGLVISDVMMPRLRGDQLYERVKSLLAEHQIPFVSMTAEAPDDVLVFFQSEGVHVIDKPITASDLRRITDLAKRHLLR